MFTCCGNRGLGSFTLVLYSWRSDQAALQMGKEYLSPSAREGWWRRWRMMELDILRGSAMVGVPSHESFLQDVSTCLEPQDILSQLSVHHHYSYYSPSDFMLCLLRWLGDSWSFAESMTLVPQKTSSAHVGWADGVFQVHLDLALSNHVQPMTAGRLFVNDAFQTFLRSHCRTKDYQGLTLRCEPY